MLEALFNFGLILSFLRRIERKLDNIMANAVEAFGELRDEANKVFEEVRASNQAAIDKISQLEQALANRELTAEEQSAFEEAKAALQKTDDLVPDQVQTPVPTGETEPEGPTSTETGAEVDEAAPAEPEA